jgi:hypothetical protein
MNCCSNNHWTKDGRGHEHVGAWHCSECRKEKLWKISFLLLIFVFPTLIYFAIIKLDELRTNYGMWIVVAMWWAILGMFLYFRKKIDNLETTLAERNYLVINIESMLGVAKQLRNKIKGKIDTSRTKLLDEAEKNHTFDDLADYDEHWGANVEKEEYFLNNLKEALGKIKE